MMSESDFQCLDTIIDLTDAIHKTKNYEELIKAIKVEFDIDVTVKDIERYYNQIPNYIDIDEEDYIINYKTCVL